MRSGQEKLSRISVLRRHPVITLLLFFLCTIALILIVALHWSAPATPVKKRSRQKIDSYRIPPGMSLLPSPALLQPVVAGVSVIAADAVPDRPIDESRNILILNLVSIAVGAAVGLAIAGLLIRILIP